MKTKFPLNPLLQRGEPAATNDGKIPLFFLAAFIMLSPAEVWAEDAEPTDLPSDYSHALPLTVTGKQGVVGFRLPQAVYLHSRSAVLADLRVFDATGAKPPFALYMPKPQTRTQQQSWPVKRFPVLASRGRAMDSIALDIKTGTDGSLLSVKTKPGKNPQPSEGQELAGLVLDVGKPAGAALPLIGALRFKLPATRQAYSAQVWLEVSDDLNHWETVGAAELSWLVNAQETLANDRLEFAPRSFRYARLSWRGGEPLDFAEITAENVEQTADAPTLERLALQPEAGKKPEDWVYRAGIAIPVESIDLRFSEPNVVLPVAIGTYRELPAKKLGQSSEWLFQPLTQHVFYQISANGGPRRSGEWPLPLSHYAEWVVRPQAPTTSRPELSLIWQPATLVFLAGGQAPYTLAFGREDAKPAAVDAGPGRPRFFRGRTLAPRTGPGRPAGNPAGGGTGQQRRREGGNCRAKTDVDPLGHPAGRRRRVRRDGVAVVAANEVA